MNFSEAQVTAIVNVYKDCENEQEREDTVVDLAGLYKTTKTEIRKLLQDAKVYVAKEGKTEKQQYAAALWAITNISEKEWMKLTLKSQKELMKIFRGAK